MQPCPTSPDGPGRAPKNTQQLVRMQWSGREEASLSEQVEWYSRPSGFRVGGGSGVTPMEDTVLAPLGLLHVGVSAGTSPISSANSAEGLTAPHTLSSTSCKCEHLIWLKSHPSTSSVDSEN